MTLSRDRCDSTLAAVRQRIDAAVAALPARPQAALRELRQAQQELAARLAAPVQPEPDAEAVPAATIRLTPREHQVLRLLAQGDRNKEIALRLGLRERTIKFHVANLLAKLSAQSRTEALRRALELGLLRANGGG